MHRPQQADQGGLLSPFRAPFRCSVLFFFVRVPSLSVRVFSCSAVVCAPCRHVMYVSPPHPPTTTHEGTCSAIPLSLPCRACTTNQITRHGKYNSRIDCRHPEASSARTPRSHRYNQSLGEGGARDSNTQSSLLDDTLRILLHLFVLSFKREFEYARVFFVLLVSRASATATDHRLVGRIVSCRRAITP